MSYMLPHLHNGWQVDQAILSEEDRVIVIRFGHDWDPTCMKMDEVLYSIAEKVRSAQLETTSAHLQASADINMRSVLDRWKISLLFTWWTSQKCQTSTRCTSCTTPAPSCSFSGKTPGTVEHAQVLVSEPHVVLACVSGTNTSWLIWALGTTTRSTGRWRTSRRW